MTRTAYIQCSAGIAGDMLLGALVDAGADPDWVAATIAGLGIDGYALTFERVQRCGVAATWANVVVDDHDHASADHHDHDHAHRPASEIRRILAEADIAPAVRDRAQAVFDALAVAEGSVHGIPPDDVEFHEVGAVDAIVDVVGIAAALDDLGIQQIVASPVATGHGRVRSAHGDLPNPPPAVVALLAMGNMPTVAVDSTMELSTPTGVAVLAALANDFGPMPPMTVRHVGYGAGTADPPGRPNVVQLVVGDTAERGQFMLPNPGWPAMQIDANVDDVTGEVLSHTIATLMEAGAYDAWATPIVMKKGRPAHTISALCDPSDVDHIGRVLIAETGTLGVRATRVERWPQARERATVEIDGHIIALKITPGRVKVEHDDALAAAIAVGRPLRDVIAEAERLGAEIQRAATTPRS